MRTGISFTVSSPDRQRLEAIIRDPQTSQKHVWRAHIILRTANGLGTSAIMATTGKSKTTVWRWQARFMAEGVDGLLYDKSRPPGIKPLDRAIVEKVVALTLAPPPHEATHWTGLALAAAVGIAVSPTLKLSKENGLAPHLWRPFNLSNDPAFPAQLPDIVGLFLSPPAPAVILSVD